MTFNFAYQKCSICGTLSDDGAHINECGWICLKCLDNIYDDSCINTTERGDEKMKLTFYKQAATPNRVDKSGYLTEQGSIDNVIIKEPRNMTHPTFVLATNPLVYNSNYLFCSFTSRYYYIDSVDVLTGGRIAINCSIDVLYTYRNEILGSSVWVERSEQTTDNSDDYDMLHNDYPFRADYDTLGIDFTGAISPFWHDLQLPLWNILMIIK